MFRTVFPSINWNSKLRIQQRCMSNSCCYLLLSGSISSPIAAGSSSWLTYTVAVYVVLSSWWRALLLIGWWVLTKFPSRVAVIKLHCDATFYPVSECKLCFPLSWINLLRLSSGLCRPADVDLTNIATLLDVTLISRRQQAGVGRRVSCATADAITSQKTAVF